MIYAVREKRDSYAQLSLNYWITANYDTSSHLIMSESKRLKKKKKKKIKVFQQDKKIFKLYFYKIGRLPEVFETKLNKRRQ